MSRRLVLVRHAKSGYPPGVPDHDRPLSDRGERDAPEIGRWLAARGGITSGPKTWVLVSSATRARLTWDLASARLPQSWTPGSERIEPRIYEATPGELRGLIDQTPDAVSTLVLVGHNPGLIELIAESAVEGPEYRAAVEKYPTSAIAVLEADSPWAVATAVPGGFRVTAFEVPRG